MDSNDLTDLDLESDIGEVLDFLSVNFGHRFQPRTVTKYTSIPTVNMVYSILDQLDEMGMIEKRPDTYYYTVDDPELVKWTEV